MKIYVSCDLDGVCGVVDRDQLFDSASADYRTFVVTYYLSGGVEA